MFAFFIITANKWRSKIMNNNLEKIHQYLLKCGFKKEEILNLDTSPVYLAAEIAEYAHLNQKRENGEDYINHPIRCLINIENF